MCIKDILLLLSSQGYSEKYVLNVQHCFINTKGKRIVICYHSTDDVVYPGTYKFLIRFLR